MTRKLNYVYLVLLSFVLLIASCTKEGAVGPAGPAGPAGPQGPGGANGANGATGATGAPGTANVIYSAWLNVAFQPIVEDSSIWVGEIAAARLVDSIVNRGVVKVYVNAGSDSTNDQFVVALPTYDPFVVGGIISPYFSTGAITLVASDNMSSFRLRNYNYYQYRYVLIPGGIPSGRGIKTIDWNDYKQVKAHLNLKD